MSKAPPLTDAEFGVAFRDSATDDDIETVLRHLIFWLYIMRDPFGRVCSVGRGTRAECIENAVELADNYAIENFSVFDNFEDEARALNGPWRLVLWPPKLDPDPPLWSASADVF